MVKNNNNKIVIDCETSGLNYEKHQIIEICIATLNHKNEIIDIWSQRCQFEYKRADSTALKINGYENDRDLWENAISQKEMAIELRNRIAGKTIIGHNVKFDMEFIVELWRVQGVSKPKYDYRFIDTVVLCHYHLDFLGNRKLAVSSRSKVRDPNITILFKKRDRSQCGYRGISLKKCVGKLFADILLQRLKRKAEKVYPQSQSGYRTNRSTIYGIITLRQLIEKTKEQRQHVQRLCRFYEGILHCK